MQIRLSSNRLPKELRSRICGILNKMEDTAQTKQGSASDEGMNTKTTCYICPSRLKRKTICA